MPVSADHDAKYRPTEDFSRSTFPEGWKCVERMRSDPFGTKNARPEGNSSARPPSAHPPRLPVTRATGSSSGELAAPRAPSRPPSAPRPPRPPLATRPLPMPPGNPGSGSLCVPLTRTARGIEEEQAVMDHASSRRPELDRAHPGVSIEIQWHDEIAIDVRAASGDLEGLAHRHGQIGRTELPPFGELGSGGRRAGSPSSAPSATHFWIVAI